MVPQIEPIVNVYRISNCYIWPLDFYFIRKSVFVAIRHFPIKGAGNDNDKFFTSIQRTTYRVSHCKVCNFEWCFGTLRLPIRNKICRSLKSDPTNPIKIKQFVMTHPVDLQTRMKIVDKLGKRLKWPLEGICKTNLDPWLILYALFFTLQTQSIFV